MHLMKCHCYLDSELGRPDQLGAKDVLPALCEGMQATTLLAVETTAIGLFLSELIFK